MNFEDMPGLLEKLGDKEVRIWYKHHDERIPDLIDRTKSLADQAKQACELRNMYRTGLE